MAIDEAPPPTASPADDARIAATLADKVRESADGVTWRKMTTLLDMFGAYRLTTNVRKRITLALTDAGLDAKPNIADAERFETVRITAHDATTDDDEHDPRSRSRTMSRLLPIDDVLEVTEWRPGHPPDKKTVFQCDPTDVAVRWFHIDVIHSEPDLIYETLHPVCPGLTEQMVVDLFTVDPRPYVHAYGDAPNLRMVSAFSVRAEESEEGASDAETSKAGGP
jgi:hypothetical protein